MDRALFNPDSGDKDDCDHEPEHYPSNASLHFASVEDLDGEEYEASDKQHDQHRAECCDQVIEARLFDALFDSPFENLLAANALISADHVSRRAIAY